MQKVGPQVSRDGTESSRVIKYQMFKPRRGSCWLQPLPAPAAVPFSSCLHGFVAIFSYQQHCKDGNLPLRWNNKNLSELSSRQIVKKIIFLAYSSVTRMDWFLSLSSQAWWERRDAECDTCRSHQHAATDLSSCSLSGSTSLWIPAQTAASTQQLISAFCRAVNHMTDSRLNMSDFRQIEAQRRVSAAAIFRCSVNQACFSAENSQGKSTCPAKWLLKLFI